MNGAPVNRPAVRREIRLLERRLSEATCSADRAPLLEQVEAKQTQLRAYYARLRELPRYDHNGAPLPRFTVHAPLEPPREKPDPERETT